MVQARAKQVIARSSSAQGKQPKMVWSIPGSIPVVLTSRAAQNSQRLSTRCFAGIGKQLNVTFTCLTSRLKTSTPSRPADGLLAGGHYKSFLRRRSLVSTPWRANISVIDLRTCRRYRV